MFILKELVQRCQNSLPEFFKPGPIKVSKGADGNFRYREGFYFTTEFENLIFSIYLHNIRGRFYKVFFVCKEKRKPESRRIIEFVFDENKEFYNKGVQLFTSFWWNENES